MCRRRELAVFVPSKTPLSVLAGIRNSGFLLLVLAHGKINESTGAVVGARVACSTWRAHSEAASPSGRAWQVAGTCRWHEAAIRPISVDVGVERHSGLPPREHNDLAEIVASEARV